MSGLDIEDRWCPRCGEYLVVYGPFPGGDPREFFLDQDISTDEEVKRWDKFCRDAERGFGTNLMPGSVTYALTEGYVRVLSGPIGTYYTSCSCWDHELAPGEVSG